MNATFDQMEGMAPVPLSLISPSPYNPRRHFDEAGMAELTDSVRANGVIQPINVRPLQGGRYEVVAGERRYRAALAAGLVDIPAVIKQLSDEEAEKIALIENTVRDDMGIVEEAEAAERVLNRANGDRGEASRALGWPLSKLNRRIALLNLVPEAREAVTLKSILVGHAELLATVPQSKQGVVLGHIISKNLSIADVKNFLVKASTDFKSAIFDTTRCITCQFNSTIQASLFVESIGAEGRCTSQDCFSARTKTKIGELEFNLREEVQMVKIIEVGDTGFVKLAIDGPSGVGSEQFEACKICAKMGATVSNVPGEIGIVEREICFDQDCNLKMVAARIKAEKKAVAQPASSTKEKKTTSGPAIKTAGSTATTEPKTVSGLSQKIIEYRRKLWEKAAGKELAAQIPKAKAFTLDLLLTGHGRIIDRSKLSGFFGKIVGEEYPEGNLSSEKMGCPDKIYGLASELQDKLFAAAAVSALTARDFNDDRLKSLLAYLDTNLSKHFTLTEEFLTLLTKSEIEVVSVSVGLDKAVSGFKKIITGKRDDAIKAILAAPNFQFEGALPSILNYV